MERPDAWHLTDSVEHESGRGDPFAAAVRATRMPMIITDPRQDDNPIVFANDAFLKLTGYDRDEVMGLNCRFLHGEGTDREAMRRLAEAFEAQVDIKIDLLNYRKNGTRFWSSLYMSPVFSEAGEVQYFFASQIDITDHYDALAIKSAMLHEVDHRVKNNMLMVSALVSMEARSIADPQLRRSLGTMLRRIEALSAVHRSLYHSDDATRFSVAEFVHDIVTELVETAGRDDIALQFHLEPLDIPADKAAPLALVVNELTTRVLGHAVPIDRPRRMAVAMKREGGSLQIEIEDDGVRMSDQPSVPSASFGQNLVCRLVRQLRATVTWSSAGPSGMRVVVDLPIEYSGSGA